MKLIVAADRNWAIGNKGGLLCHLPNDLKYFKEKTLGKTVVMGRKTLESLPGGRPLKNRKNVVLTRRRDFLPEECIVASSVEDILARDDADMMVIGGESVYRQLLPYCESCYVTRIDSVFEADTYFPDLDSDENFNLAWQSEEYEENGIRYRFTEYRRK